MITLNTVRSLRITSPFVFASRRIVFLFRLHSIKTGNTATSETFNGSKQAHKRYGCMSYYFAIIGTNDQPIYELEAGTYKQGGDGIARFHQEVKELNPYILHASLDIIEDLQWKSNGIFFKNMDHFYGFNISGYLTAGNIKFLMLSDMPSDVETSIRQFFVEVNDLYVKTLLSPFYNVNKVIKSGVFDSKVKSLVKKYL